MGTACGCTQRGEITLTNKFPCQGKKHLSMSKAEFQISPIDNLMDTVDEIPTNDDERITIHHVTVVGVSELETSYKFLICAQNRYLRA